MPASLIQSSFTGGVIAPSLHARVDLAKYQTALKTCKNFVVMAHGGLKNRAGLYFGGKALSSSTASRVYRFAFNTTQTYALEFGHLKMRVVKNGGHVLETALNISGATQASPIVITTSSDHGYSNGDEVEIASVGGMTEINGRRFTVGHVLAAAKNITDITAANPGVVTSVAHGYSDGDRVYIESVVGMTEVNDTEFVVTNKTADTFELGTTDTSGYTAYTSGGTAKLISETTFQLSGIDGTDYTAYTSGGTASRVYTLTTPYASTDLLPDPDDPEAPCLKFTQSTDTLYITHPDYAPRKLTRTDHDAWTMTPLTFAPEIGAPTGATATQASSGSEGYNWKITTVAEETFEESLAIECSVTTAAELSSTDYVDLSWSAPAAGDVEKYNVYRKDNGLFGYIGSTEETSFKDDNINPDLDDTPPKARNPFNAADDYPGTVGIYEQRATYGSTNNRPDTSWLSQSGNYVNMNVSTPSKDDDAITFTLAAHQVNEVRHMVPLTDLIILTSGSEWRLNGGGENAALTPTSITVKPQSHIGSSHCEPIVVGSTVIHVVDSGDAVRDLFYKLESDSYDGNDLAILSNHLLEGRFIVDWDYAKRPNSIIWCVLDNGDLLSLTYMREHEVWGWAIHTTGGRLGKFESVCCIREGRRDVPYFVVKRYINGAWVRHIEWMQDRIIADVRDAFFVDAGVSLDIPITISGVTSADPVVVTATAHGLTDGDYVDLSDIVAKEAADSTETDMQTALNLYRFLVAQKDTNTLELADTNKATETVITGATQANPVVITCVAHGLVSDDEIAIFNVAGMTELNGKGFTVANATDDTFELSGIDGSGYTAYTSGGDIHHMIDGSAYTTYLEDGYARKCETTLGGLWHLEGESLTILADGNVHPEETVVNGQVTLDYPASRVHAGKGYQCDIETLSLEPGWRGTIQGRLKSLAGLKVRVEKTRGLWAGPDADHLYEQKERDDERYGEPIAWYTGDKELSVQSFWTNDGRVFLRQPNPLPATVLAIIPELAVGG